MIQLRSLILPFFALLILPSLAIAQTSAVSSLVCENNLIDPGQPPVVITFDHTETNRLPNGKKVNAYWFKLRNNSRCEIGVEAAESAGGLRIARNEAGQFARNSNGGLIIEHSDSLYNGSTAPIIYHLFNARQKSIGMGNSEGCIVMSAFTRPNSTVLFRVASPDFKKDHTLSVVYLYKDQEPEPKRWPFTFEARYAYNALPAEAFITRSVTK